jgi:hypothetical protein
LAALAAAAAVVEERRLLDDDSVLAMHYYYRRDSPVEPRRPKLVGPSSWRCEQRFVVPSLASSKTPSASSLPVASLVDANDASFCRWWSCRSRRAMAKVDDTPRYRAPRSFLAVHPIQMGQGG